MAMKKNVLAFAGWVCFALIVVSCDSDQGNACPKDFVGALTGQEEQLVGTWVLSEITSESAIDLTDDEEQNPSTDLFEQYSECDRDASYIFDDDRTYRYDLGQRVGDCDYPITATGSWKFSAQILSLTSTCSIQTAPLKLNAEGDTFTFSEVYKLKDVHGTIIQTKIVFTYSLAP